MPAGFPQNSRFPFSQLVVLELTAAINDNRLPGILKRCPCLQELRIASFFVVQDAGPNPRNFSTTLNHLRLLQFAPAHSLQTHRILEFFSAFVVPSLASLAFPESCSDATSLATGFSPQSGCALTSLEVSDVRHRSQLLTLLARHETIEHLSLPNLNQCMIIEALCDLSRADFASLPQPGSLQLLPRLRSLRLVLSASVAVVASISNAVLHLLDARMVASGDVARLERVEVISATESGLDEALEPLRQKVITEAGRLVLVVK
ncbi:hypothetical protein MKEN_00842800 [Mycena kentingensis (nom. inval.)]|nr:hypothetical protein MKEN_00842800 [Mycena kentingensis (nom. inval.)]